MKITSSAFENDKSIPQKYTCQGDNINPELSFSDVPKNAQSLVLIMHDPDAPMPGGFTHWVLYNIPPNTTDISEGSLPANTQSGRNGAGNTDYIGPCPPSGEHHYKFKLHALDISLNLQNPDKKAVEDAIEGHVIEKAELVGLYKKE